MSEVENNYASIQITIFRDLSIIFKQHVLEKKEKKKRRQSIGNCFFLLFCLKRKSKPMENESLKTVKLVLSIFSIRREIASFADMTKGFDYNVFFTLNY